MKRSEVLLIAILSLNLLITGVSIANQSRIIHNQVAINSHLNSLTTYLSIISGEALETPQTEVEFDIHLRAWHRDKAGNLKTFSEHAGTLTTIGANYIEGLLGNNATDASAQWISLSNDGTSPSAAWTQLPTEIAANNLSRALGTYTSTGDGQWTITYTFTASGTQSLQLAGLQWAPSGDNNLLCADQITSVSMEASDTLELEWSLSVS